MCSLCKHCIVAPFELSDEVKSSPIQQLINQIARHGRFLVHNKVGVELILDLNRHIISTKVGQDCKKQSKAKKAEST